jgi:phosphoserine aminotransferase
MSRVYNFSAGPAVMPEEVLKEAAAEMLDYNGSGMSVMEISHRSALFQNIIDEAEKDLRDLMNIPDNYKVLFIQGGGHMQFAMVPMNLMQNKVADYIITGQWAKKAWKEGQIYGNAKAGQDTLEIIVAGNDEQFTVTALFDNLGKGASGAAVQNMNIMLGFEADKGLNV